MIAPLHRFVEALRARGVSLSPAEVLDAARAVDAVGPEDRARFRAALAATLAKDRRALALFDETFEGFFAPPARASAGKGRGERGGADGWGGAGAGPGSGERRPAPRPDDPEAPAARRPSRPAPRDRASARSLRALPASMLRDELGKARSEASRDGTAGARRDARRPVAARRENPAPRTSKPEGAAEPARRARLSRLLATEEPRREETSADPRRRDLAAPMTPADERELAREIPRVLDEIRLRHTRRMRRAPRGRLFMKRAIRENLATGGVPFRIPMRRPRRKRARVVLVVDVSWSVATASGLFLLLAMEVLRQDRRVRVFFFVDHPVEATDVVRGWLRRGPAAEATLADPHPQASPPRAAPSGRLAGSRSHGSGGRGRAAGRGRGAATGILSPFSGRSFGALLDEIPGLDPGAASDYGRAFWALGEGPLRVLAKEAVLVVLGDARTNRFDPLPWAFEEIAARARRVLWLVPEPRVRWGTGDSALLRYLPFCDVAVEARDLAGLAHGVREMTASL
jgi:uncharacterized protein with von Willebrand factor type A (vWA) domain